jgi:hypothetical protein
MRTQYDAFLALAAQVAVLAESVGKAKEEFLNYRRRVLQQTSDPFEQVRVDGDRPVCFCRFPSAERLCVLLYR